MKIFSSIILERLFDGIAVFIILLTAVLLSSKQAWVINLTYLTGFIFIGSVITAILIYKFNKTEDIFNYLSCIKYVIYILVLSLIIWGIECLIAYYIFIGFNIGIGLVAGLFVISLTSFSTMIPSTSMFLGPYQYAYILALGLFGISKSQTLAISTIHQGILMLVLSVIGIFLLLKFNISIKDIRKNNRI